MSELARRTLTNMIASAWTVQALYVAATLGVADRLTKGPKSVEDLAHETSTNPESLYRLLRALASIGVFTEGHHGFDLTPMAEYLRSDSEGSVRAIALMHGAPWHWRAWEASLQAVRSGGTGFAHVNGAEFFDYLHENTLAARTFDEAMSAVSHLQSRPLLRAYDFDGVNHLVDVGGGQGVLLSVILKAYPTMTGTLYDLPALLESSRRRFEDARLGNRWKVSGGDFLEEVPEGDGYLLAHVLHDWDDERALTILRNCRRSISEGGRLVILEAVLPPGNVASSGKLLDLEMMICFGGRERTEPEYAQLLEASGFRMTQLQQVSPENSVIEAQPIYR